MAQAQAAQQDYAARVGAAAGRAMAPAVGEAVIGAAKQQAQGALAPRKDWLYCIPMMPGVPTAHSLSMKRWFLNILILQGIMCVLRFIFLKDIMGGLWMALAVGIGLHGYWEFMNITFICCWGILCLVNGFFDCLEAVLPLVFGLLSFDILNTGLRILLPFSYLLGASFAYHIYLDFAQEHGWQVGWITKLIPDVFWLAKRRGDKFKSDHGLPLAKGDQYYGAAPNPQQSGQQQAPQQQYQQQSQQPYPAGPYPNSGQTGTNSSGPEPQGGGLGSYFGFGSAASLQSSNPEAIQAAQQGRQQAQQAQQAAGAQYQQARDNASLWGNAGQQVASDKYQQAQADASFWRGQGQQAAEAQYQQAQNSGQQAEQAQAQRAEGGKSWW